MNELLTPKFLTREVAAKVVTHVLNCTLLSKEVAPLLKRRHGHLIVLVPSMKIEDVVESDHSDRSGHSIDPHVLYEQSVGDENEWDLPFHKIAHSKALQLWQGRNSDGQTDSNAHLLFSKDTPFWGGVKRHGIVVAFSGVQPWFDQMISGMTADMLKAYGREAFERSADKLTGLPFLE